MSQAAARMRVRLATCGAAPDVAIGGAFARPAAHPGYRCLLRKASARQQRHGVWVPAFAGTTRADDAHMTTSMESVVSSLWLGVARVRQAVARMRARLATCGAVPDVASGGAFARPAAHPGY